MILFCLKLLSTAFHYIVLTEDTDACCLLRLF